MKFIKTHEEKLEENYVELHYRMMDEEAQHVEKLFVNGMMLVGKKEKVSQLISPTEIYYLEVVDRHLYAYLEQEVWQLEGGLQEVVDRCREYGFVRIGKSMAVNIGKVKNIVSDINARIKLGLSNGEIVIMNRAYKKEFFTELKNRYDRIEGKR